jgi:hypothetical protein
MNTVGEKLMAEAVTACEQAGVPNVAALVRSLDEIAMQHRSEAQSARAKLGAAETQLRKLRKFIALNPDGDMLAVAEQLQDEIAVLESEQNYHWRKQFKSQLRLKRSLQERYKTLWEAVKASDHRQDVAAFDGTDKACVCDLCVAVATLSRPGSSEVEQRRPKPRVAGSTPARDFLTPTTATQSSPASSGGAC